MSKASYNSDQKIADAYGIPYIFEEDSEYIPEDENIAFKRVLGLHNDVTRWIEKHRRIPSNSPNAEAEERKMAIWLRVVMWYKDTILDPNDEHGDERESNEKTHKVCQHLIRNGEFPQGENNE